MIQVKLPPRMYTAEPPGGQFEARPPNGDVVEWTDAEQYEWNELERRYERFDGQTWHLLYFYEPEMEWLYVGDGADTGTFAPM